MYQSGESATIDLNSAGAMVQWAVGDHTDWQFQVTTTGGGAFPAAAILEWVYTLDGTNWSVVNGDEQPANIRANGITPPGDVANAYGVGLRVNTAAGGAATASVCGRGRRLSA